MGGVIMWLASHQLWGEKPWEGGKWDKQNSMGCRMGEESLTNNTNYIHIFCGFFKEKVVP